MWGNPHISWPPYAMYGGRRLLSSLRGDHSDLPALVAGPMREEPIVIAFGAGRADCDLLDSGLRCVLSDQRTQVDVSGPRHRLAGELFPNIGTHLITTSTDRGSEVDRQLVWWKTI